jgi:hypothetical protein
MRHKRSQVVQMELAQSRVALDLSHGGGGHLRLFGGVDAQVSLLEVMHAADAPHDQLQQRTCIGVVVKEPALPSKPSQSAEGRERASERVPVARLDALHCG